MSPEDLLTEEIQEYILKNRTADVKELALRKIPFNEDLRAAVLQHIKGWQKARAKLPEWAETEGILFPSADLVEQSSSQETAEYKAFIAGKGNIFLDLTAGLGSDSLAISRQFTSGYCVEADPIHTRFLAHNLKILSTKNIITTNDYAENFINKINKVDLAYIDPQRRTDTGKRGLFDFHSTQPDVISLLPALKEKADRILIKASPFLDISAGLRQLGGAQEIHVVESEKQCKEVLYLIDPQKETASPALISAVCSPRQIYKTDLSTAEKAQPPLSDPLCFLYEPCPALMKSGAHGVYGEELGLHKLAPLTHLYTSDAQICGYMGRAFKILAVLPVQKKDIHRHIPEKQANITVRHFPQKAEDLRKKLQLKDGGPYTLFGCTLQDGAHKLILCEKTAF